MGEKTKIMLRYISESLTLIKYSADGPCFAGCYATYYAPLVQNYLALQIRLLALYISLVRFCYTRSDSAFTDRSSF